MGQMGCNGTHKHPPEMWEGQEGGRIILESRKIITKRAGPFRASPARTVNP